MFKGLYDGRNTDHVDFLDCLGPIPFLPLGFECTLAFEFGIVFKYLPMKWDERTLRCNPALPIDMSALH